MFDPQQDVFGDASLASLCGWNVHVPTEYPIFSFVQAPVALQYPKTPNVTPWYEPSGMPLMMGVEIVERIRRTKAIKKSTVRGVAGRNIMTTVVVEGENSKKWASPGVLSEL